MRGKSWRVRTGVDYHLLASMVLHGPPPDNRGGKEEASPEWVAIGLMGRPLHDQLPCVNQRV